MPNALNRDDDPQEEARNAKPLPFIGMKNPQSSGYKGNSPSLGIARDYPKAGK